MTAVATRPAQADPQVIKVLAAICAAVDLATATGETGTLDKFVTATTYELPHHTRSLLADAASGAPGTGDAYLKATGSARRARQLRQNHHWGAQVASWAIVLLHDPAAGGGAA